MGGQRYSFGPFVLDLERGALLRDGVPIPAGNKATALLGALLAAENRAVAKHDLVDAAWPGIAVEESNLSVQIATLRKLLGPNPAGGEWITTVPRVGYRFAGTLDKSVASSLTSGAAPPALMVQRFISVTGDPEGDPLAAGITEDIVAALARFRWFSVIRQGADPHFVLTGSVRRSGSQVRISAQLVAAATGAHVWAEKYDAETADLFAVQDEIAARVAGAIEPELLRSDAAGADGGGSARDLVRRGTQLFHKVTRVTHHDARALFRKASNVDPTFIDAHIWRARVCGGLIAYRWTDDPVADAAEGIAAALTAIRLDEQNPYAHYGLAIVSIYAGNPAQGIRAAERAVEVNASFALGHLVLGMGRLCQGDANGAVGPLERGLELSPHDPQNFVWLNFLALARVFSDRAALALDAAQRVLKIRPDWRPGFETLVFCQATMGDWAEAHRSALHMQTLRDHPGDALGPFRSGNPTWASAMAEALRRATSDS
jgi:TolB-like protein